MFFLVAPHQTAYSLSVGHELTVVLIAAPSEEAVGTQAGLRLQEEETGKRFVLFDTGSGGDFVFDSLHHG